MEKTVEEQVIVKFPAYASPFLSDLFTKDRYRQEKISNFILNMNETQLKMSRLNSYPYYLVIDPTNICMLKCPLCPTWQDLKSRPKGRMDKALFTSLLDEVGKYLFAVNLCNWGEPLLNPDVPSFVRYAKKYNIVVGLSTNLNYLPKETAGELIASGIDIIVISLDGATQESYGRYRREGSFSKVLGHVEILNSYRRANKKFPLLIWQFLVNKYNEHEIGQARNMAQKNGLMFLPSSMRTSMGKELLLPLHERVKEMKDWLPENAAYNRYAYDIRPETRTAQATCQWIWNTAVVNWDGSVSPCCGVYEKKWDFARCHDDSRKPRASFHEAWNSPRYRLARALVAAYISGSQDLDELVRQSEQEGLICSRCIKYGFLED